MIETEQIVIMYSGDPSVGIPDGSWTMDGFLSFDDQDHLDAFKEKMKDAFEEVCDQRVGVLTKEELEKIYQDEEDALWEDRCKHDEGHHIDGITKRCNNCNYILGFTE